MLSGQEKNQVEPFCNKTSLVCKFSKRGYANFLHNQRISEIASSCILESRVNQTNLSNINNILTQPSTPVNREEDQPE